MTHKKRTPAGVNGNDDRDETSTDAVPNRDDGLTIHKARVRHDEAQPPRNYKLRADGWPVEKAPPRGARALTPGETSLVAGVIHMLRWTLMGQWEWTDRKRDAVLAVHAALQGAPYSEDEELSREQCLVGAIADLLRGRAHARVYARIRKHKALDAPLLDTVDLTGKAIVSRILSWPLACPAWLRDDTEAPDRLAKAIDDLPADAINPGGSGGRSGGRTPDAWAQTLVLALKDRDAARADYQKRRRRNRRERSGP